MTGFAYGWFDWPNGSVLTNLIASAICAGFVIRKIITAHKKLHARLDYHEQKLQQIHQHLKDHE